MNIITFGAVALCTLFFGWVYIHYTPVHGKRALPFKGIATFMAVMLAFIGACDIKTPAYWMICLALLVCVAADIVLELNTKGGICLFLAAQILFIVSFLKVVSFKWYTAVFIVLIIGIFVYSYGNKLHHHKNLAIFAVVYCVALAFMSAMAMTFAIETKNTWAVCSAVGGLLFVASDYILTGTIVGKLKKADFHWIVLLLYYCAVLLLAAGGHGTIISL